MIQLIDMKKIDGRQGQSYAASYVGNKAVIEVRSEAANGCCEDHILRPVPRDILVHQTLDERTEVTFIDGMMHSLKRKGRNGSCGEGLLNRSSSETLENIRKIQKLWKDGYSELFDVDEYARAHRDDSFVEIWASRYEILHAHTFRVLARPRNEQTQGAFMRALETEDIPHLRAQLFTQFTAYLTGKEYPACIVDRLKEQGVGADYLRMEGRHEDAEAVRQAMIRDAPIRGRWKHHNAKNVASWHVKYMR